MSRFKLKVKVLFSFDPDNIEKQINEFLSTLEIENFVDIKYSASTNETYMKYTAIILYKDLK